MPVLSGLRARVGIELQVGTGQLRFRRAPDEQVIDLRVARQLVEVERLERAQPVAVERLVAHIAARHAARAASGGRAGEPLHDVAHLVLRQRENLVQVRDVGKRRRRGRGNRRARSRGGCDGKIPGRHLVAQQPRVVPERLVGLGVGASHPPGERRVVTVVEGEPLGHGGAQLVDRGRPESRLLRVDARRSLLQSLDFLRHAGEICRRTLRVHVLDANPGFDQLDEGRRKRHHGHDLRHRSGVRIELRQVVGHRRGQPAQVGFRLRRQPARIDPAERGLPVQVVALQARDPRRRHRHLRRRRSRPIPAAPAASAATGAAVGVVPRQRHAIQRVALRHHPHLALRRREERAQVGRRGLLFERAPGGRDPRDREDEKTRKRRSDSAHRQRGNLLKAGAYRNWAAGLKRAAINHQLPRAKGQGTPNSQAPRQLPTS